jgi:hypothetical protein
MESTVGGRRPGLKRGRGSLRTHEVEGENPKMKKLMTYLASAGLLSVTMCLVGCGETEGVKTEVSATGPGGTTTITKKTEVETTGDNPPVVTPAEATPATP